MRDVLRWGGRFIPDDIFGVCIHIIFINVVLARHDRATENNHKQQIESLIRYYKPHNDTDCGYSINIVMT